VPEAGVREPREEPKGDAPPVGAGLPQTVELGRIVGTHGACGELRLLAHNRDTDALVTGLAVRLEGRGEPREFEVAQARHHKAVVLLTLRGVDTLDAARALVGARLLVRTGDLPALAEGEFYWFEVLGLQAVTEAGQPLGRVTDILANPGHDVYVVQDGTRERLVPAVDEVVVAIEPEAGRIVIRPPDGLLEL
jgi:16S rRNA processing protein RimM